MIWKTRTNILRAHDENPQNSTPEKLSCTSDHSSSLGYLYDTFSVHVRGLSSLTSWSVLKSVIMSKLPKEIRVELVRKSTSEQWKTRGWLETIKGGIKEREK